MPLSSTSSTASKPESLRSGGTVRRARGAKLSKKLRREAEANAAQIAEEKTEGTGQANGGEANGSAERADSVSLSSHASLLSGQLRQLYAPTYSHDDASATNRKDSLGMTADARAFAYLAVSKNVTPPLAVGIFGQWGAGKSFFMNLIQREADKLSQEEREKAARSSASPRVHEKVIQIRFNAWHYAETNLWASLVGHIFQELSAATQPKARDAIFGRLSTARNLTLEAATALAQAKREHLTAKSSLEVAQETLARKKAQVTPMGDLLLDALRCSLDDVGVEATQARKELSEAARELGLGDAVSASRQLTRTGMSLVQKGVQGREIFAAMVSGLGTPKRALLFALLVAGLPLAVVSCLRLLTFGGISWLSEAILSGSTAVFGLAAALQHLARPVQKAIEQLQHARKLIDARTEQRLESSIADVRERQSEVARAVAGVEAASEVLKATTARLATAREELVHQSSASRLIDFVRARAAGDDYAKHLGLISTIRRDFEELSNLFSGTQDAKPKDDPEHAKAFKAQVDALIDSAKVGIRGRPGLDGETEQLLDTAEIQSLEALTEDVPKVEMPFQRIVLYIDDVDRCAPDKVVDVLQAVHMLLAFRLFVVFVAVDVKWVSKSLAQQYRGMLKEQGAKDSITPATDYLEKIFQIPYWVESIDPSNSRSLMMSALDMDPAPKDASARFSPFRIPTQHADESAKPLNPVTPKELTDAVLDDAQRRTLLKFSRMLDSPRKILRLVNIVRFLKARGELDEGEFGDSLKNHCVFAQLAIATASPESYYHWRFVLGRLPSEDLTSFYSFLFKHDFLRRHPAVYNALAILSTSGYQYSALEVMTDAEKFASRLSFAAPNEDREGFARRLNAPLVGAGMRSLSSNELLNVDIYGPLVTPED